MPRLHLTAADLSAYNAAVALLDLGLRVSLVCTLTGISPRWVRDAYRQRFGEQPKSGKLPETCLPYLAKLSNRIDGSGFAHFYFHLYGDYEVNAERILESITAFRKTLGRDFDPNMAYFVCRDIAAGVVTFRACPECAVEYIKDTSATMAAPCPYCRVQNANAA